MERSLGLTIVNHALNRPQPRDQALAELETQARDLWPMSVAEAHAFVGHKDLAFEWLQRAYDEKDTTLYWNQRRSALAQSGSRFALQGHFCAR